jgi:gluconolactonase
MFAADAPRHIRVFDVEGGARLRGGEVFYVAEPGFADGLRADTDGNVWTSAGDGVHCVSPAGELLGKIKVPEVVANVTFGGRKKNRLFICGTTSIYAVYLNRRGVQWP